MEYTEKHVESPDPENPDRRAFALQSILAMLAGVTITISACGDDSSPTSPDPGGSGRTGSVTANHGHSAVITGAQLMAADAVMLNIRGSATHPHTVELSAAEIGQIAGGQRVSKVSSTDDSPDAGRHSHVVTFN
jgi:hypothetical protein